MSQYVCVCVSSTVKRYRTIQKRREREIKALFSLFFLSLLSKEFELHALKCERETKLYLSFFFFFNGIFILGKKNWYLIKQYFVIR